MSPLGSAFPGYNQARYSNEPALTREQVEKIRTECYATMEHLVDLESKAKNAAIHDYTNALAALDASEARVLGAIAQAQMAGAISSGAVATLYTRTRETYNDARGKTASYAPDTKAVDKVHDSIGDLGKSLVENGVFADVAKVAKEQGPEQGYEYFKQKVQDLGGTSAEGAITRGASTLVGPVRTSTIEAGLHKVGDDVQAAMGYATGPDAELFQAYGKKYHEDVSSKIGGLYGISSQDLQARDDAADQALAGLREDGEFANSLRVGGLPEAAVRKVMAHIAKDREYLLHPEQSWKNIQDQPTPQYIVDLRNRTQARLDGLAEEAKDPYDRALGGYIARFRKKGGYDPEKPDVDPWMAFMGAMRFGKGVHAIDKAAVWAAKHQPQVEQFLAHVRHDPSLADLSNPDFLDRAREVLHGSGLKTSGLERTTGIAIKPKLQPAAPAVAEEEPEQPRIAPTTPTATEATEATDTKAAPPAESPTADAKPGAIARTAASELYMEPSGWQYAYNTGDASVKIIRAPPGHERAVAAKPLHEGKAYDAIMHAISSGKAKPFGPKGNIRSSEGVADGDPFDKPALKDKAVGAPARPNLPDAAKAHDQAPPVPATVPPPPAKVIEPPQPRTKLPAANTVVRRSLSAHTAAKATGAAPPSPATKHLQELLQSASDPAARALIQKQLDAAQAVDAGAADTAAKEAAAKEAEQRKALLASYGGTP